MFQTDYKKIFNALKDAGYEIYATVKTPDGIYVKAIESEKDADYSGKFPADSWKQLIYPSAEVVFRAKNDKLAAVKTKHPRVAFWGINVVDLKALQLFDLIFKNYPFYIERRKSIFIMGFSAKPLVEYQNFSFEIHSDILERLNYDLFILKRGTGLKLYSASATADRLLKAAGTKADVLAHPQEPIQEDRRVAALKKLVESSQSHPVWQALNERCIACGKCSIVCPTCYCFDLIDTVHTNEVERKRVWGDCFYSEFTRIAGNYIFLKNPSEKLFFWYTHKFSRIPEHLKFPGCVGCRRCYEVCPVFIDIEETLADLKTDKAEKSTR